MASSDFLAMLATMREIHIKKNADYAEANNPFSNFEIASKLVSHFSHPIDQVFVTLIGIKLARLSNLLNTGKLPDNESIADTFIDGPNYFALWGAYHQYRQGSDKKAIDDMIKESAKEAQLLKDKQDLMMDNGFHFHLMEKQWRGTRYNVTLEHIQFIKWSYDTLKEWMDRVSLLPRMDLKDNG